MNKEEFLKSINKNMKLSKNTFLLIYCYEISYKGFSDQAISKLEECGCSKARSYYKKFVSEWKEQHEAGLKRAAEWYGKKTHEETERQVNEQRKVQKMKSQAQSQEQRWNLMQRLRGY